MPILVAPKAFYLLMTPFLLRMKAYIQSPPVCEEKEKFQKLAEEERQRHTEAPKKRQKTQGGTRSSRAVPNTPAPDKPEELIGKRVQHLIEEFDGSSRWYYGIITGLKVRRGKYMYSLVYDGETETFIFPLLDDMEKDELRIVPLDPAFLVGRRVDHRFRREADGEEFWYTGTVTGHDADTGLSTIAYDFEDADDDDDDDDNNSNVFEEPVIEDYQNGDVLNPFFFFCRLLSRDLIFFPAQVKQQLGLLDIKLLDIEMKLRESENEDNLKISRIQKQLNDTTAIAQVQKQLGILDIKMSDIEMQLNESKHECSLKISRLQTQITDSTAQVGFTAHGQGYGTRSPGYQLKFPLIRYSIGISNLASMTNNGTFVCEKKGLYLVTVTGMACSRGRAAFTIYKNHWEFMKCYIGRGDYYREDCHSGVGTGVVVLGVNDVVYVRVRDTSITLYENWSSFSAVKLK
ncbi:unnamed protein product [Mytilus edulis]|uniref:C1q domain-containing protein n=1 Tax=Mytilus edulis TaxID=6550 RepID=A0A8S3R7E7_MYTED|nr:unnamed protein product [Mytilus edulis]